MCKSLVYDDNRKENKTNSEFIEVRRLKISLEINLYFNYLGAKHDIIINNG